MLSINTNLSSLIAQQSMTSATNKLNQAIERMTTGYKINGAKDNAANYSISTNMTTKINSYMVAEDNVAMGLDMLSTANGSLDQISDKLTRLRALATQASNGTYGGKSLLAINAEANSLVDEINRIYSTAEYNGRKLFTGTDTNATPAVAAYGARAASTNTTYTDEEVAAMTSISDVSSFTDGEFYSISTAEELARLAELTNSGVDTTGATFVLANDIDLKEWCEAHAADGGWKSIGGSYGFHGSFDGNGHVISNLTSSRLGLFGYVEDTTKPMYIKNVGLENVNINNPSGGQCAGFITWLLGDNGNGITISNNYITGNITINNCADDQAACFFATAFGTVTIENNYSNCNIISTGNGPVAGFVGTVFRDDNVIIRNNYVAGNVSSQNGICAAGFVAIEHSSGNTTLSNNVVLTTVNNAGALGQGFVGERNASSTAVYDNNYSVQADNYATQMTAEEILSLANLESMGFTEANGWTIVDGQPVLAFSMAARNANAGGLGGSNYVTLQVGINADSYSQIGLEFGFALDGIEGLRQIGLDTSTDFLSTLDTMLNTVSAKATEYGAAQNRLESALDEIAIQYDNLVSSRSTLRDADIAEVSSLYIQQQILQQASATLLATANQSPSIALQLI